mgnify:CR=1 FL=1
MNVVIIGILGLLFLLTVYIVLVVLKVKFAYKSWVWLRKLFGTSLIEQANTACPGYKFSAFGYDTNDDRLWDIIAGECPVTPTNLNNTVPSTWSATDKAAWVEQAVSNCAPRYPADLLNSNVYTNDDILRFATTIPCPKGDPETWSTGEGAWWDNMIKTRCPAFNAANLKTNQNKVDLVALPSCTVTDEFTKKLAKTWCPNLSDTLTNEQYTRIALTDHTCPVPSPLSGKNTISAYQDKPGGDTNSYYFKFIDDITVTIDTGFSTTRSTYTYNPISKTGIIYSSDVTVTGTIQYRYTPGPPEAIIIGTQTIPISSTNLLGNMFRKTGETFYFDFNNNTGTFNNLNAGDTSEQFTYTYTSTNTFSITGINSRTFSSPTFTISSDGNTITNGTDVYVKS